MTSLLPLDVEYCLTRYSVQQLCILEKNNQSMKDGCIYQLGQAKLIGEHDPLISTNDFYGHSFKNNEYCRYITRLTGPEEITDNLEEKFCCEHVFQDVYTLCMNLFHTLKEKTL